MFTIRRTLVFAEWFRSLRDLRAQARIQVRIDRLSNGLFGDVKYFQGIGEARIDHGPGYRLYFVKRDNSIIVLLCGGDKSSQERDIKRALELSREI